MNTGNSRDWRIFAMHQTAQKSTKRATAMKTTQLAGIKKDKKFPYYASKIRKYTPVEPADTRQPRPYTMMGSTPTIPREEVRTRVSNPCKGTCWKHFHRVMAELTAKKEGRRNLAAATGVKPVVNNGNRAGGFDTPTPVFKDVKDATGVRGSTPTSAATAAGGTPVVKDVKDATAVRCSTPTSAARSVPAAAGGKKRKNPETDACGGITTTHADVSKKPSRLLCEVKATENFAAADANQPLCKGRNRLKTKRFQY